MSPQNLKLVLQEAAYSAGISPEDMRNFFAQGQRKVYAAEEWLFHESTPRQWAGTILEGEVNIARDSASREVKEAWAVHVAALLGNVGAWPEIAADRATPYQQMHVWDRAGIGEIHFDAADVSEPDLGHIVENRVIVRALWRALETDLAEAGLPGPLLDSHASYFAESPVFLSRHHVVRMGEILGADPEEGEHRQHVHHPRGADRGRLRRERNVVGLLRAQRVVPHGGDEPGRR